MALNKHLATHGQKSPHVHTPSWSKKCNPHPPEELRVPGAVGVLNHEEPIHEWKSKWRTEYPHTWAIPSNGIPDWELSFVGSDWPSDTSGWSFPLVISSSLDPVIPWKTSRYHGRPYTEGEPTLETSPNMSAQLQMGIMTISSVSNNQNGQRLEPKMTVAKHANPPF